jgi:hypothetical protein
VLVDVGQVLASFADCLVDVDLNDGDKPVQVEVEFLAPKDVKLKKNVTIQLLFLVSGLNG